MEKVYRMLGIVYTKFGFIVGSSIICVIANIVAVFLHLVRDLNDLILLKLIDTVRRNSDNYIHIMLKQNTVIV